MSAPDDDREAGRLDLYEQSVSDHAQLQQRLPQEAVVSLAREVLNRLARDLRAKGNAPDDIDALADALIAPDAKKAAALVDKHLAAGVPAQTLYRPYLARAAKRLGEQWEDDTVTFAQLTVGIGRIYAIMRTLRARIQSDKAPKTKSAIFASVPGDDHTLGVKMATDLARNAGWDVDLKLNLTHDELVEEIVNSGQLIVGLSGGGEHALPNLARLVLAVRITLPEALILVSGNIVEVAKESVALMHVDAIAREYDDAMGTLTDLWHSLQREQAG